MIEFPKIDIFMLSKIYNFYKYVIIYIEMINDNKKQL